VSEDKAKRNSKDFEKISSLVDQRRVEEAVRENIDAWRARLKRDPR
jgi:Tfp pilus assembly pilus retraction ATPase PilT